jgi:uncharacterized membrane protein
MGNRTVFWVAVGLLVIGTMAGVEYWAYNAGLDHGLANAHAAAGGTPVVAWPRWGFGFGFFPLFPIFFILLWVFLLRGLFWRGRSWGRACGYGYRSGGVPPQFEEWHRRAHGQSGTEPA